MPKPPTKPSAAPQRLLERRIAVIGTGKIGGILLQGLLKAGLSPERAFPTVRRPERARSLSTQLAIPVGTDNRAAARQADVILLCVKPQAVREVIQEIQPDEPQHHSADHPTLTLYQDFLACVKTGKRPDAYVDRAVAASRTCWLAELASERKAEVKWDEI